MGATRDCGTLPPPARPTLRLGTLIGSNRTRTEPALKTSVYGEVVYISRPNTYPFLETVRVRVFTCVLCTLSFWRTRSGLVALHLQGVARRRRVIDQLRYGTALSYRRFRRYRPKAQTEG